MPPRRMSRTFSTPGLAVGGQPPGPPDQHRPGTQRQRLDHVRPRRTPPSISTSTLVTDRRGDRVQPDRAGVPSRLLPPWLDTEIGVHPGVDRPLRVVDPRDPASTNGVPEMSVPSAIRHVVPTAAGRHPLMVGTEERRRCPTRPPGTGGSCGCGPVRRLPGGLNCRVLPRLHHHRRRQADHPPGGRSARDSGVPSPDHQRRTGPGSHQPIAPAFTPAASGGSSARRGSPVQYIWNSVRGQASTTSSTGLGAVRQFHPAGKPRAFRPRRRPRPPSGAPPAPRSGRSAPATDRRAPAPPGPSTAPRVCPPRAATTPLRNAAWLSATGLAPPGARHQRAVERFGQPLARPRLRRHHTDSEPRFRLPTGSRCPLRHPTPEACFTASPRERFSRSRQDRRSAGGRSSASPAPAGCVSVRRASGPWLAAKYSGAGQAGARSASTRHAPGRTRAGPSRGRPVKNFAAMHRPGGRRSARTGHTRHRSAAGAVREEQRCPRQTRWRTRHRSGRCRPELLVDRNGRRRRRRPGRSGTTTRIARQVQARQRLTERGEGGRTESPVGTPCSTRHQPVGRVCAAGAGRDAARPIGAATDGAQPGQPQRRAVLVGRCREPVRAGRCSPA